MLDGWFRLASHLSMTLAECMTRVTWPEFLLWQKWLDDQWNKPDRTDHYLMMIAHQAAMAGRTKSKAFRSKNYTLKFESSEAPKPPKAPQTVEEATAASKRRWALAAPGIKFRKINKNAERD